MIRKKNANAVVYRKVASTLFDSTVAQCLWAVETLGLSEYFEYIKSRRELVCSITGGRILFKGADDPEKSKGLKPQSGMFRYLWFEELTEFSGMDEIMTIIRSIVRDQDYINIFYTYNPPKSVNNWVNQEIVVPRADRLVHRSTYLDLPKAWLGEQFFIEAEALRVRDESKYRWAYLGESTGYGGAVFDNVKLSKIPDTSVFDKLYGGLDFGYSVDPTAYVVLYYHSALRTLYILDEFYSIRASYDTIAKACLKQPRPPIIMADSAEPRSIAELRSRGASVRAVKKSPGSVEHGITWLQNLDSIIIDPSRTPNAAREFTSYEYLRDKHGAFLAVFPDRENHSIDAVRYALEPLISARSLVSLEL